MKSRLMTHKCPFRWPRFGYCIRDCIPYTTAIRTNPRDGNFLHYAVFYCMVPYVPNFHGRDRVPLTSEIIGRPWAKGETANGLVELALLRRRLTRNLLIDSDKVSVPLSVICTPTRSAPIICNTSVTNNIPSFQTRIISLRVWYNRCYDCRAL